jgi:serine/threonine-protein kinase ULK/ATG1
LPSDHPSHPDNQPIASSAGSSTSIEVVLSPGVTAEKLMYDRALEMSRAAAINELTGDDLAGCEIAYVTAIRMLEAVLENDGSRTDRQDATPAGEKVVLDDLQAEDRQVVLRCKFS